MIRFFLHKHDYLQFCTMHKVLIVDDEASSGNVLKILLNKYIPNLHVIGISQNIQDAEKMIHFHQPEIVFLDVKMPGGGGFELLTKFENINFAAIFVTAYEEFALKAFKVNAVDYLLKPINKNELLNAVDKSIQYLKFKNSIPSIQVEKKLTINKHKGESISLKSIICVKADSNYSTLICTDKTYTLSKTLKEIEELICDQSNMLLRIHKSFIVNTMFISSIQKTELGNYVILKNNIKLQVSKRKWPLLKQILTNLVFKQNT